MVARIAVVGGGISGLTAAYRLRQALGAEAHIDLYEAGERLGGVLRTTRVGGRVVDVGAEAFIVRRPEARDLVAELGLADRVVSPTARRSAVWSGGRAHPLPTPALMGIPASSEVVAGLADPADVAKIAGEPGRPLRWRPGDDPSVGELVADRFGESVVARSVDPLLGGVYASRADAIGLREALPALAARLDAGASDLTTAVTDLTTAGAGGGPVFGTLVGGYEVLIDALARAAGLQPALCSSVLRLEPRRDGWTLQISGARTVDYDGVVLAVPAWVAGRLLHESMPGFAAPLRAVRGSSSLVLSIALAEGTALPDHSGVLVATGEALHAKAFTFSSQKWAHLSGDGPVSVRASFGRFGAPVPDEGVEPGVDDRIRAEALADLDEICADAGVPAASSRVIDVEIQRWTNGLPVYSPGHAERMRQTLADRPSRLALAGSAYAGVGVPACIGQAAHAVAQLVADLDVEE